MNYSAEIENMYPIGKGPNHANAPIPIEGNFIHVKEISDISRLTHGVGNCYRY